MDNQLEAIAKQVEEKAEENGMVSTLYKRKVTECEDHVKELASLREITEKQAERIHELETNLVAMDAAHDNNEETIRQLRAVGVEAERLKEEVQSKATAIAELHSKLDAKDRMYVSEVQSLTSNVARLAQSIQGKDQLSRLAVDQAAEAARRETRMEMERSCAEAKKLTLQAECERNLLANQVEELKQGIQQRKQRELQDTATIHSLQHSLSSAEAKGEAAAQELTQCSAKHGQLESRLMAKVSALETEIEVSQGRAAKLEEECHRQGAKSQALITALTHWALRVGLDISALDCLNDSDASAEEISAGLAKALERSPVPKKPQTAADKECREDTQLCDKISKFFPSDAGQLSQGLLGDSSTLSEHARVEGDAPKATSEVIDPHLHLHHLKRVIVHSPASIPAEPVPPSIDQEKIRRREALQPKSIMKRVTRSTSSMLQEEALDEVSENGAFVRDTDTPSSLPGDRLPSTGVASASSMRPENVGSAPSGRSNKRRRSEALVPESSSGRSGRSKQVKTGTSEPRAVSQTEEQIIPNSQPPARHQEQLPKRGNPKIKPGTARSSRRGEGTASQSPPSVNSRQALDLKQANVRTYGSQKADKSSNSDGQTASQFSGSQSQSQPRYWSRSKESQDSLTFSKDGFSKGESLQLPL